MNRIIYCSKCNAAMGYRIDALPEVWRESWRCFVCGRVYTEDHPRYDLNRNKANETAGTDTETRPPEKVPEKPPEKKAESDPQPAEETKAVKQKKEIKAEPKPEQLDFFSSAVSEPEKRRRGRPRKN